MPDSEQAAKDVVQVSLMKKRHYPARHGDKQNAAAQIGFLL
jgi:hypothetical protein